MLKSRIAILIPGGAAKPNPKLGQALGPLGINMAMFCKEVNERTAEFRSDVPLRIMLSAFTDRTYAYKVKPPPTSWMVKKCVGLEKLGNHPKHKVVGTIKLQHVFEIAKIKREMDEDLAKLTLEMICKVNSLLTQQIIAQCHNMGVVVVPGKAGEKTTPIKITLK